MKLNQAQRSLDLSNLSFSFLSFCTQRVGPSPEAPDKLKGPSANQPDGPLSLANV